MTSELTTLADKVQRLSCGAMSVDLVDTSRGTVRIGSMPNISKFLRKHGFREEIVVVPEWEVSSAGDNRTGEEFVLWQAQISGGIRKKYVGLKQNVGLLQTQLSSIFPYFFDEKNLSIVKKDWMNNWFQACPVEKIYRDGELEIVFQHGEIRIRDGGSLVYLRHGRTDRGDSLDAVEREIETLLAAIPRDTARRDCLEILPVGCGNGFHGVAANTIIRFGSHVIWIDPCGFPAHTLASHGVHWDDITHYLITHNHEDHLQGLTACLHRARLQKRPLKLLLAKSGYQLLLKTYSPLFPDLKNLMEPVFLQPGKLMELDRIRIESRWNHHILPYGTLGLRISAGGSCFGYSGDTKYDDTINRILNREELTSAWFAPCDLIFHEIEFDNPESVHSHWKQVQSLQNRVPGQVLGYHTCFLANSPFPLAKEGERYYP